MRRKAVTDGSGAALASIFSSCIAIEGTVEPKNRGAARAAAASYLVHAGPERLKGCAFHGPCEPPRPDRTLGPSRVARARDLGAARALPAPARAVGRGLRRRRGPQVERGQPLPARRLLRRR